MTAVPNTTHHRTLFTRPSTKTVLSAVGVVALVWAALGVQAAILSDRQDASETRLNAEIQQIKASVAAPAQQTAAQSATRTQAAAPAAPGAAQAGAVVSSIDLKATDNKFSQTQVTAATAQPFTLTFTNAGAAMHNVHIVGLAGTDGKDVKTALTDGGKSAGVSFTPAAPGTYKFQCDVHPAEMTGTFVVR